MKRILTSILLALTLVTSFPLEMDAKKDKNTLSESRMMTSEGEQAITGQHKFVIDGHVAIDIPDSCYNIYMTDIDKEITESDLVACVPVKNKRFRFETDLSTMKAGRIRAIMPGDDLCPAWIQIYFIPGFTVDMTVHNGYYDIHNQQQYTFMTNAWLNKDSLADLFESFGVDVAQSPANSTRYADLMRTLQTYRDMINNLQSQINMLKTMPINTSSEMLKLLKRIDDINSKMELIIDQYADSFKY